MIRQFEQRWKCGKGSSLSAKFAQAIFDTIRVAAHQVAPPKGVLPRQKPLRSCHKRLESVAATRDPATSSDRSRVQRGSPRAFCRHLKTSIFINILPEEFPRPPRGFGGDLQPCMSKDMSACADF
jgi:hypothetical protein